MAYAMQADDRPNFSGAREKARELVADFSAPSIPVVELAESNGVNVVFVDFGKYAEKVAGLLDFAERRIYVNKADIPERQRFTIAHELGHWMLHRPVFEGNPEQYPILPRFQSVDKNNAFEQEANAFASELLVPQHLLTQVRHAPPAALADVFNVSRTMMEYRLKNVGR